MKRALSSNVYGILGTFGIAVILSAPAYAQQGQPFLRLQQQIDVLNRCNQPVLIRLQVELLREASDEEDNLGAVLGTSLVSAGIQEEFLRRYLAREGSLDDFWEALGEDTSFTDEMLYELRLTLFLGRLTYYQLPLLVQLRGLRQAEGLDTLRDISTVSRERWRELLAESGVDQAPDAFLRHVGKTFDVLLFGGCN